WLASAGEVEGTGEGGPRRLAAKHIVIATGSKPAALPGLAYHPRRIVHSTHPLSFSSLPPRLAGMGPGGVGLRLGSVAGGPGVWRRLGSDVTVAEYMDRALPGVDAGSAKLLQRSLERQGMKFRFGVSARSAKVVGDEVRVEVRPREGGAGAAETLAADVLLVA